MQKPKYQLQQATENYSKIKTTMHSVTLYTLVRVIHPHNFHLLYYVAPMQMPNYGFGKMT